jgi:23S rRNA pseudouridine2605 synthase
MQPKGERIAKIIAAAGVCSRRDAERLIAEGKVSVNGKTLETPATLVSESDAIKVNGKLLQRSTPDGVRLWLYHKPPGLMTTHHDPDGRPTVFEHLPAHLPRVVSVGRLDLNSEGLLLLTTSGELSRALELPQHALARIYRVRINGMPSEKHLYLLGRGVTVEGVDYKPLEIEVDDSKESGRNRWLTVTLREGKNREIRKLFEYYGYPVSRLIRIAYGPFALEKLNPGEVKEATREQLDALQELLAYKRDVAATTKGDIEKAKAHKLATRRKKDR